MDVALSIKKIFSFFLFLSLSFSLYAQSDLDMDRVFFQKMMKRFEKDFREAEKRMDQLFQQQNSLGFSFPQMNLNLGVEKYWKEEKDKRILVIKALPEEGSPMDIRVQNGVLSIEGSFVQKSRRQNSISQISSSFKEEISLPQDVDANKMEIKPKEGELWILFPKYSKSPNKKVI